MRCCRRWGSTNKEKGIPMHVKGDIRAALPSLLKLQLKNDQVTPEDMIAASIPRTEYTFDLCFHSLLLLTLFNLFLVRDPARRDNC